ncbi:MAG TPA: hypothetical protein VF620_08585 [Allosphingosinicella sp.]|jgi:hypothetical protein
MSNDPRKQRHQPPGPSHWLLLMKAVIAIGQVVSFVRHFFLHD